jgi:hypothetical protein
MLVAEFEYKANLYSGADLQSPTHGYKRVTSNSVGLKTKTVQFHSHMLLATALLIT